MKIENVAVISLEDYAEYQKLKNAKEIDYLRIRVGSRIKIKKSSLTAATHRGFLEGNVCQVVAIDSSFQINKDDIYLSKSQLVYTTVMQRGNFYHVISTNHDYITEVIDY